MRVLTYTSLFPTNENELTAPFIGERIDALSRKCSLRIISPIASKNPLIRAKISYFRQHEILRPTYLALPSRLKQYDGKSMYLSTLQHVKSIRKSFKFDIIDAHWSYPDGYAALLIAKKLKVPIVITVRGSDIHRFLEDDRYKKNVKFALENADGCIAVSEGLRKFSQTHGIEQPNFSVVRNGIDSTNFHLVDKNTSRSTLGISPKRKLILYVGRIVPNKRLDIAIQALSYASDAHLFIIGMEDSRWKDYKSELIRLSKKIGVESRVVFVGPISRSELKLWYSASDCVCLCSDNEGCPNVLLEAAACGTPVVARAVGGVPEIVANGETGILVDSASPEDLGEALRLTIETCWNSYEIAKKGQLRNWDQVADQVFDELSCALDRAH